MTGPEHYREAEERLRASDWQRQEGNLETAMHEAAVADVHATLALTAATSLGLWLSHMDGGPSVETSDWYAAVSDPEDDAHEVTR